MRDIVGRSFRDNENFRNQRSSRDFSREMDGLPPQSSRAPLQWAEATTITVGQVCATISTAEGERGDRLYSFSVGRVGREPGRTSKFFQPRDIDDLVALGEQVRAWIETDRKDYAAKD